MKNKMMAMGATASIDDNELLQLKELVDRNPQLYLDEIALRFGIMTEKYLCSSTIWRYLSKKLGYVRTNETDWTDSLLELLSQFETEKENVCLRQPTRTIQHLNIRYKNSLIPRGMWNGKRKYPI